MTKKCRINADLARELCTMNATEFRQCMDQLHASLDHMALMLGISRRNVAAYRSDKPIPAYIALATRELCRSVA